MINLTHQLHPLGGSKNDPKMSKKNFQELANFLKIIGYFYNQILHISIRNDGGHNFTCSLFINLEIITFKVAFPFSRPFGEMGTNTLSLTFENIHLGSHKSHILPHSAPIFPHSHLRTL